ncbi:MAG: sigma-70 family RNA polymerase sigma factor [Ilumatobacteraceae bacterium]
MNERRDHARPAPDETAEQAIARYRETGDRAVRNQVVQDHWWLAMVVAKQLKRSGEELEDLAQVAMVGILKAIERFDPDIGASFSTYASATARGEVRRHYRDASWSVSVPRRLKELRYGVGAATEVLRERLRRPPTSAEVADYLHLRREEVDECLAASSNFRALPIEIPSGEQRASRELRDDHWEEQLIGELDTAAELVDAFAQLPERLRRLLVLRYVEERKQTEIAEIIGISQVHVSRLLRQTVTKLRDLRISEPALT